MYDDGMTGSAGRTGGGGPGTPGSTSGKWQIQIRPLPQRLARTKKIKESLGLTAADIYDLGLDAAEAKRTLDPATEMSLHAARLVRQLLSLYDFAPYDDPDEERDLDRAFLDGAAVRHNSRVLRTGMQKAPVRMRAPE